MESSLLPQGSHPQSRILRLLSFAFSASLLLAVVAFISNSGPGPGPNRRMGPSPLKGSDPGPEAGGFNWTDEMLAWQRAGFHFRPPNHFMGDPSAPMYYKGWYHFFYNYNQLAAYWGNMTWGHGVSKDLINWIHLPVALRPDRWYDMDGIWTGSAVDLGNRVIIMYTGGSENMWKNELMQVVNLAEAVHPLNPLLIEWTKYEANPIIQPPAGIGLKDFRDPNPIWYDATDSTWRVAVGSRKVSQNYSGIVLVYTTKDFKSYTLLPNVLHSVNKVGMFECVELYPVVTTGPLVGQALPIDINPSETVKYVLKAGSNDEWLDYYAIGTYDPIANKWTPDDVTMDVGIGLRYDWGTFYASRTFYDPIKLRRVLWGTVGETDERDNDVRKGWASFQVVPRTVLFDVKTGNNLLTWPIEEVESLRKTCSVFNDITVSAGSTVHLSVGDANQLDIEAQFEVKKEALEAVTEADVTYNCRTSGGATNRGFLGPFGLLVLANEELSEQVATYFYITRGVDGSLRTHFCQDELRSSKANDNVNRVVGSTVPVLEGELLSVRILVDHSIVESFAQGGRTCITSRAYPTEAINEEARVFLFNNATSSTIIAKTVTVWHMGSSRNEQFFPSFQVA